jgi:sporulation protein YlmC with PRC-barrel domain
MPASECRVELLIGRRVVDVHGDVVGRLEEVVADYDRGEYLVREFHVGSFAAFERLGGGMLGNALLRLLGGKRFHDGYAVPWNLMDLTEPDHPRVTVAKGTLQRIGETQVPELGGAIRRTSATR